MYLHLVSKLTDRVNKKSTGTMEEEEEDIVPAEDTQRSRRRATTAVNYAKEQEFSDASDIFEDSDGSVPKAAKKRGRSRKSDANEIVQAQEEDFFKKTAPVYSERGYDPALLPIRERFSFLPEFESDGSPKIDLIVGRRPIDEKESNKENDGLDNEDEKKDEGGDLSDDVSEDEDQSKAQKRTRRTNKKGQGKKGSPAKSTKDSSGGLVEYEYLIKYKGRSYLHLEWKGGADLESMNKTAKGIYRRYLKRIGAGDEEAEDPNFDPSFAIPQRICDEARQEITVDLSDKELLKWEKERAKELATEGNDSDSSEEGKGDGAEAEKGAIDADKETSEAKKEDGNESGSQGKNTGRMLLVINSQPYRTFSLDRRPGRLARGGYGL
jgi:hypothetical protein